MYHFWVWYSCYIWKVIQWFRFKLWSSVWFIYFYRLDRDANIITFSKGGRVLVGTRSFIKCELLYEFKYTHLELLCVKLVFLNIFIILIAFYVSSSYGSSRASYGNYESAICEISKNRLHNDKLFAVGYFNLTNINWKMGPDNLSVLTPANFGYDIERGAIDITALSSLYRINNIHNDNNRLLDLCFTDNFALFILMTIAYFLKYRNINFSLRYIFFTLLDNLMVSLSILWYLIFKKWTLLKLAVFFKGWLVIYVNWKVLGYICTSVKI